MRILLTGASGMVGRNLLENPGNSVFEILAPTRGELNLLNYSAVERYFKNKQPDMIIHAAGLVGGIQANIKEPVRFLLDNLDIGRNVIVAARQAGIRKVMNLGSSCMYPRNGSNPLVESDILRGELEPTNEGYALAKIIASRLCEYIGRENAEFNYKTLVPCNLYGRWDKFDPEHSHLIPAIIHKIHQAKVTSHDEVVIWGDGTARREFMYAGDFADCIVNAICNYDSMPTIINIGLGHDYAVNEYYEAVAEVIGYKGRFVHDLSKPVGMNRKMVDISRQDKWGWKSRVDLHEGLTQTYEFYLQHYCTNASKEGINL